MAKTQGDGEDERWLAGLRGGPSDRDGDTSRGALAPDPWLDGPFPTASANETEPTADPSHAVSGPPEQQTPESSAAPDPWSGAAPMPTYRPQYAPAPMPQVAPASEPVPIPRLNDPWAPRAAPQVDQADYEIPRLTQPQGGDDRQPQSGAQSVQSPTGWTDSAQSDDSADSEASPESSAARESNAPTTGQFDRPAGSERSVQEPVQRPRQQPAQQQPTAVQQQPAGQSVQQQPTGQHPVQEQPAAPYHQPQPHSPQYSPIPAEPPTDPWTTGQQPTGQPYTQQPTSGFQHPGAPTSGAFSVPQQDGGVPAQLGGTANQPPSIMPLDLSDSALVRQRKVEPDSGWRKAVYRASFGGINPGISREQIEKNALIERIRTPIRGCHKIAVVSLKGGIGKTTTTSCLGLTLAHYRGDRVVALDANPDAGTLAERLTGVTDVSVRDMLENIERIDSFTDISRYMSLASRLQVLASDQDAEVSEAFDSQQYRKITGLLSRYYNVILTDSGTGMLHSAMQGTLEEANSLVVVGAPSVDGSSRAAKTLDWLVAHGYGELVAGSVAVISSVREKSDAVDMDVLRNHFGARCRSVIEIPYDPHLVIGGRIDMTQIRPQTEHAYLELAATVADGFGRRG